MRRTDLVLSFPGASYLVVGGLPLPYMISDTTGASLYSYRC